jgi:4-alpha-glucanotransferase
VAVQLYTLRSRGNWGIGDFSDLCRTWCAVARRTAPSFVGPEPAARAVPRRIRGHFSPYSPSSRHFLNVLYIAVPERLPEFAELRRGPRAGRGG